MLRNLINIMLWNFKCNLIINQYEIPWKNYKNTLYISLNLNVTIHTFMYMNSSYLHHHNYSSFFAYTRSHSRRAWVGDLREARSRGWMVHKCQVLRNTNIALRETSPGASHQWLLIFLLNYYLYVKIDCALSL
jgi:hypothetical protein